MKRMVWWVLGGTGVVVALYLGWTGAWVSSGRAAEPGGTGARLPRVVWKADGSSMVLVPAGPLMMGSDQTEAEKPRHQVEVPAYYLDLTEVTWRKYLKFCKETSRKPPVNLAYQNPWPEEMMERPVANVTWDDALAYCQWTGRRLPSEAEFEKACAGDQSQVYPWGNGWNANACVNRINSGDHTAKVGTHPGCKSPYGILDLSGNVWEWTADWYKSYPGAALTFDYTGDQRVAKGGAFFYSIDLLRCANRYPLHPDDISDHGGFRCAVSPDEKFKEKIE